MEKRFSLNFILVVAAHVALIFLIIYYGNLLTTTPKPTEKVAWMSPGVLTAMGQQGMAKEATVPAPSAKQGPSPQSIPKPPPPSKKVEAPPPPDPTPVEKVVTPPQPSPQTPPAPEIKKTPVTKKNNPSTPPAKKIDIPVKSDAKGDLNVGKTPTTPAKNSSPEQSSNTSKTTPEKTGPIIKKSNTIVKKSATGGNTKANNNNSTAESSSDSSSTTSSSASSSASSSSAQSDAISSLESIAGNIAGSGAAKSGLTTSMTIGTYGVEGGKESDYSDYFLHIKGKMIDAWDQPKELLAIGKKFKTGIKVKITRSGAITAVTLSSSSGNSVWDESALAAARKVSKVNSLPEGLGDDSGLNLTIYFEPED